MKRLLGLLLVVTTLQPFFSIALTPNSNISVVVERKKCCHGCGSYGCNALIAETKAMKVRPAEAAGKSCEDKVKQTSALTPAPLVPSLATVSAQADKGNPDVKVWVNTNSGVYHCPGTRWYGNTKQGEYMNQAEAQKKGYRPAYGKVCR
jgi:hypothetical protein